MRTTEPSRVLEEMLQSPPRVHDGAPTGVWHADEELYWWLVDHGRVGRSLETGAGLSTLLLSSLSDHHVAVTPVPRQAERLREALDARELPDVEFLIGPSEDVVPALAPMELDLLLIDGGHAYPTPQIDWFYGARRLRRGGVVIVDDLQLAAPFELARFLDRDPRWTRLERTSKWAAWRRENEGGLAEEWTDQSFHRPPVAARSLFVARRAVRRARRLLG